MYNDSALAWASLSVPWGSLHSMVHGFAVLGVPVLWCTRWQQSERVHKKRPGAGVSTAQPSTAEHREALLLLPWEGRGEGQEAEHTSRARLFPGGLTRSRGRALLNLAS